LRELAAKNFRAGQDRATPFAGYYGVDCRLMMLVAMDHDWPGAAQAYDYLQSQTKGDLAKRAGWAIAPDPALRSPGDRLERPSSRP
jgi:hypothetical protein